MNCKGLFDFFYNSDTYRDEIPKSEINLLQY
jgi:hypothetical protein